MLWKHGRRVPTGGVLSRCAPHVVGCRAARLRHVAETIMKVGAVHLVRRLLATYLVRSDEQPRETLTDPKWQKVLAVLTLSLAGCTATETDAPPTGQPPSGSVDAGAQDPPPPGSPDAATEPLSWRTANLTNYTSYPDPGSEECVEYNGCEWAGWFAALDEQQPESWVMAHNIAAVNSTDFDTSRLKTLRLRQDVQEIDVVVYDMCADSDCDGCCTQNSRETGFLIDIESYTAERFGSGDGVVQWACLDCQ